MRAYIDRILVREVQEETTSGAWTAEDQEPDLKALEVISAGDSPDGRTNEELEGKIVYVAGKVNGIPQQVDGETLYIYRRHQIETIK